MKKFIKNIINIIKIIRIFIFKLFNSNTIKARIYLSNHLWSWEQSSYSYGITHVKAVKLFGTIYVTITTLSPGLLIGRRGENIDRLKEMYSIMFEKPVKVLIEECNPFSTKNKY